MSPNSKSPEHGDVLVDKAFESSVAAVRAILSGRVALTKAVSTTGPPSRKVQGWRSPPRSDAMSAITLDRAMTIAAAVRPETRAFIGGEYVGAKGGATFATINPATGQPIVEVAHCMARGRRRRRQGCPGRVRGGDLEPRRARSAQGGAAEAGGAGPRA